MIFTFNNKSQKTLKHNPLENVSNLRAVIYVSSRDDNTVCGHKSALNQFIRCNHLIKKMGWKLVGVCQDEAYLKHNAWVNTDAITQDIINSKFDCIVCTSIKRLPKSLLITLSGLVQKIEPTDAIPPKCYLVSARKLITDSFLRKYCTYKIQN